MRAAAKGLGLRTGDTVRWLWSYYGSRLPIFRPDREALVRVTVRAGVDQPLPLLIRINGHDWRVVEEIFLRQIYQTNLGGVRRVLDLGGNIGMAALSFARAYPDAQICAVEPAPDNLALLNRNVALNSANVRVLAAAAGPHDGGINLAVADDPLQYTGARAIPGAQSVKTIRADLKSVPSILKQLGWLNVDLLKIDIEGGEATLLSGRPAWLNSVRTIIGEGHAFVHYDIEACRRDLEPMGFEVTELAQSEGAMLFVAHRTGVAGAQG